MGCKWERGCQYPPDATSLLSEDLIVCPLHPREEPLHNIYSDNTNILVVLCNASLQNERAAMERSLFAKLGKIPIFHCLF